MIPPNLDLSQRLAGHHNFPPPTPPAARGHDHPVNPSRWTLRPKNSSISRHDFSPSLPLLHQKKKVSSGSHKLGQGVIVKVAAVRESRAAGRWELARPARPDGKQNCLSLPAGDIRTPQPSHRRHSGAPRRRPGASGGNEGQSCVEISSWVGQGRLVFHDTDGREKRRRGCVCVCAVILFKYFFSDVSSSCLSLDRTVTLFFLYFIWYFTRVYKLLRKLDEKAVMTVLRNSFSLS